MRIDTFAAVILGWHIIYGLPLVASLHYNHLSNIAMTRNEVNVLKECMHASNVYLEYGCGGSTLLACEVGIPVINSIDTHPDWVAKMRQKTASCTSNISIHLVDVGPVRAWGYPISLNTALAHGYASAVSKMPQVPDLVLIDGRWRISAFFFTYIAASSDTLIAVHDFKPRPLYHLILPYVTIVKQVDALVVVKKKPFTDVDRPTSSFLLYLANWYLNSPS
ncbi:MAG: hypothetical protein J3K34DRAFT_448950 [Monoraphidium minutum]|nr:MAG: hypothetical protein J3K34DRAFT_450194 [Monoraphidium minutum]KAI8462357.1 MAG: hypothetical protein J3K34DRAFT_448950 [Monoraphidium minutum]